YGFAGEARRTGTVSILQAAVGDAQRGRVMSTQFLLERVAGGIGAILIGSTAERTGLRTPMLAAVAVALAPWCVAIVNRKRIFAAFRPAAPTPPK
ncbi:MAG: hypothetical protein ABSG83_17470, partial [Roseiarcus sp.]